MNILIESYPDEIWKPLPDYPDYHISNYGRILNRQGKELMCKGECNDRFRVYDVSLAQPVSKNKSTYICMLFKNCSEDDLNYIYFIDQNHLNAREDNLICGKQNIINYISEDGEEWKEIPDYPYYWVSNYGKIFNWKSMTKETKFSDSIDLCIKGTYYHFKRSRLMVFLFFNNADLDAPIYFKDGSPNNCRVDNMVVGKEEILSYVTLDGEEWRPVKDDEYKGYYISSYGRVLRLDAVTNHKTAHEYFAKILSISTNKKSGYNMVSMRNNKFCIHRLIAEAFIPNPENKKTINHIDGNPLNNSINNLEWCTQKENVQHAFRTGLIPYTYCKCLETGKIYKRYSDADNDLGLRPDTCGKSIRENKTIKGYTFIKLSEAEYNELSNEVG